MSPIKKEMENFQKLKFFLLIFKRKEADNDSLKMEKNKKVQSEKKKKQKGTVKKRGVPWQKHILMNL